MERFSRFYLIINHNPKFNIRKIIFIIVKVSMYFSVLFFSLATNLKEIRLAIDAISVPRPPRLTPINKFFAFSVNFDSRIAAGTFENSCPIKQRIKELLRREEFAEAF